MSDDDIVERLKECSQGLLEESMEMQEETGLGLSTGWECIHGAVREIDRLRADLVQRTKERDRLAQRVAELERGDPLAEMWRELAEYQPQADRDGHGESWKAMCVERTKEAAWRAAASDTAAESALRLADSVAWVLDTAAEAHEIARRVLADFATLRRAREVQP